MPSEYPGSLKLFEGNTTACNAEQEKRELFWLTDSGLLRYLNEDGAYFYIGGGSTGPEGPTGPQGPSGLIGPQGVSGLIGASGIPGPSDHGDLTGLSDDDHSGIYYNRTYIDNLSGYIDTQDTSNTTYITNTSGQLDSRITENDGDISDLSTDITNVSGQLDTRIDDNTTFITNTSGQLDARITSNDGDISTLTTDLANASGQLSTRIDDNTTYITNTSGLLDTRITSNDVDISNLTTNLSNTSGQLNIRFGTGTDNYVARYNGTNAIQSSNMYISDDGNVGIGTDSPSGILHVYNGDSGGCPIYEYSKSLLEDETNLALQFLTPNNNAQYIVFSDPEDADAGFIRYNHSNNSLTFRTNGTNQMTLDDSTNVGIGTSSPNATLDVSGDIIGQYRSSDGTAGFTGTGSYTNFTIKDGIIVAAS